MTRVAVVGAGAFGLEHLAAYSAMPDVEIVGVADTDRARAERAAARYGTVVADVHSLHADAVSVVVPAYARGDLVKRLVDGGLAVLIEKPLARDFGDAQNIATLAVGRPVMVGHVLRFAEPYRRLVERSRMIGSVRSGALCRRRSTEHAARHPHDDVVGLTMIHDLDALPWLAGSRAVAVSALGTRGPDGRWVSARAEVTLASGSTWTVEAQWTGDDASQRDTALLEGDAGIASLDIPAALAPTVYGGALAAELRHFVDHARDATPSPVLDLGDAVRAVQLADGVRHSLDTEGQLRDLTP